MIQPLIRKFPIYTVLVCMSVWLPVVEAAPGEIEGTGFRDFNVNGVQDSGEPPIEAVIVKGIDDSGNTATTTTDSAGLYTLQASAGAPLALSGTVRMEFTLPASLNFLFPGASGGTSVQFADIGPGATGIDVGFANPAQFAPANAELVTTITYMGDSQAIGYTTPGLDAVVGLDYDTAATDGANIELADVVDVGATWGVAYQRSSKGIFVAATMKRHASFGPLGTGGIYAIDRATPGTVVDWLDLDALGIDTGTDTRDATAANSLPDDAGNPSYDVKAFKAVAKIGIGDIDMDENDTTLWLINLNDRKLYGIQNVAIGTPPVAGDILGGYDITDGIISCPNGVLRPWGVTAHEGRVYVGAVCSGELINATRTDLTGHILRFDPDNPGLGFTEILSIDFNDSTYNHILSNETGNDSVPSPSNYAGDGWQTWYEVEQFASSPAMSNYSTSKARYSVPLISDIEFDSDGNMLIGVMSRWGLMQGQRNYAPVPGANDTRLVTEVVGAGDTLRACVSGGVFTLESNASCGGVTTGGAGNGAGPGGGEYYFKDNGPGDTNQTFIEQSMGAMAIRPGGGDVVVTVYDPQDWNSNGMAWWNDSTALEGKNYRVYVNDQAPFYGKGNGMGDIEVMADPAPIEVGNRVWNDVNANGIQDGGEGPMAGVVVGLYDNTGTLIETVTTAADGTYIFSNDPSGTDSVGRNYDVAIDTFGTYTVAVVDDNFNNVLNGFEKTSANAEGDTSNDALVDVRDSDGVIVSVGTGADASIWGVSITLGSAGHNNHSLDFGVNEILADLVMVKTASPDPAQVGQQLTYTLTITNNGPSTATNVIVTDTLSADVTHVSTTPSQGSCSLPTGVTCELGDINNGASATVTIVVTVN
jgi:uncharacterized repeat protein (TIGR01451 family)